MSFVLGKIMLASETETADEFGPIIGWHTVFRDPDATVTASAETASGQNENAWKEGLTYDFWRPGSSGEHWLKVELPEITEVNYLGIAAHDLHARGCSVKVQYSTDGGSSWIDASDEYLPPDSTPILILFDTVSEATYRVLFTSASAINVGVVMLGAIMHIPIGIQAGWIPPYFARDTRSETAISERGAFLGRNIIAEGASLNLELTGLTLAWIRETWETAVRQIESYGFFFCARDFTSQNGIAEEEVLYAWAVDQPSASYDSTVTGKISLTARGIVS